MGQHAVGGAYEDLRTFEISPHWLHIGHLDVQHWASSGLLAVFFYIAASNCARS